MEGNIWEISISCPAPRLLILLSPEQRKRTEEPLNSSQQAARGGFAAVGSRHMLGAGSLGQLLCGRFLPSGPLICFSVLCSMMGRVLRGTEKSHLKDRPSSHQLSATPVENPSWAPGAEG